MMDEAFEKAMQEHFGDLWGDAVSVFTPDEVKVIWQAAWNARGEVDAGIAERGDIHGYTVGGAAIRCEIAKALREQNHD